MFRVVLIISALIASGGWLYYEHNKRPALATGLAGIDLGIREGDVTLEKGKPASVIDKEKDGGRARRLVYDSEYGSYLFVDLAGTPDELSVRAVCERGGNSKLQGFGIYSRESDIIEKLGLLENTSMSRDGVEKAVNYPRWQTTFVTTKGTVVMLCAVSGEEGLHFGGE